jgi:hypothetical protein
VVGYFVILILARLLEISRDLLCTAIDAFLPQERYEDVQTACVQEVRVPAAAAAPMHEWHGASERGACMSGTARVGAEHA